VLTKRGIKGEVKHIMEITKVKELVAEIKKAADAGNPEVKDEITKMVGEALEMSKGRKGEFDNETKPANEGTLITKSLTKKERESPEGEKILKIQSKNDDIYLMSKILRTDPKSLKMFKEFKQSELAKSMHDAAGYGAEWVPTGFSADLSDRVYLELKVANLFNRIQMPQDPYTLPIKSAGATVYKLSESQTEHESATKITKTEVTTTNVTLASTKLGCRVNFSEELTEDSIIPILPMLKSDIAVSMAQAIENTVINGDTTSPHQDSDTTTSTDVRKSWIGLRKGVNSGAKVSIATFNADNLRAIRKAMGKYGVNPAKLALIVGVSGYIQLLGIKDSSNNPMVTTIDKYGPNATIVTGELAKFDGMPVIVSEYIRENLNASGVYDGTTTTKTIMLMVYRDGWIIGDRRNFTLKVDEDIETDQTILVATQRLDMKRRLVTTELFTGLGYNLTS